MRRFRSRSDESISAVHVSDYTTQDRNDMQTQSSPVSNSDNYDAHI